MVLPAVDIKFRSLLERVQVSDGNHVLLDDKKKKQLTHDSALSLVKFKARPALKR